MGPTGRLAWQRSATSCAAGGGGRRTASGVERVGGDGPAGPVRGRGGRQGTRRRGPRASTPRRGYARPRRSPGHRSDLTHCRPLRRLSPGFRSSARRLREARRAAGRMWVGVQVGATRRRDRSPPDRRPAGVHVDVVDVVGADSHGPLWGPASYRGSTPERRSRRGLLGGGPARGVSPERCCSSGHVSTTNAVSDFIHNGL